MAVSTVVPTDNCLYSVLKITVYLESKQEMFVISLIADLLVKMSQDICYQHQAVHLYC